MSSNPYEDPSMDEAFKLIIGLFEHHLDNNSISRLDNLICHRRDVRRLYVKLAHQYCALVPLIAARGEQGLTAAQESSSHSEQPVLASHQLNETMILPALHETDATGEGQDSSDIFQPAPFQPQSLKNHGRRISRVWYRIAMVMVLAILATIAVVVTRPHRDRVQQALQQPTPAPPLVVPVATEPAFATITATAGIYTSGLDVINPKTDLVPGRNLTFTGGAVELTFATGATVIVRGPAQVRVTDRNTLTVDAGSVYAHVPPSAIGFSILAPGLGVVDRGTNFGVRIRPGDAGSEVHVFDGRVDATALDGEGNSTRSAVPVKAGDAVAHSISSPSLPLEPIKFQESVFDRDIDHVHVEVPSHGTGAGLDAGLADLQWQLISVPNDPSWTPRPAYVVVDPRPEYVPNSAKSKWISKTPHLDNVAGGDYVYRTTIDLTGLNPTTISVMANFAVDDSIREIRVNGHAASLPNELTLGLDTTMARTTVHQLPLSNVNWVSGPNQVEVVVWNLLGDPNLTGLQLSWKISASPIVMR